MKRFAQGATSPGLSGSSGTYTFTLTATNSSINGGSFSSSATDTKTIGAAPHSYISSFNFWISKKLQRKQRWFMDWFSNLICLSMES